MQTLLTIAYSVIAGIVLNVLWELGRRVFKYFRSAPLRAIWRPFLSAGTVTVVLTTRPGPHPHSSPRVSVNEMRGYSEITKALHAIGVGVHLECSNTVDLAELLKSPVMLIGGPISNTVAEELWARIQDVLPFALDLQNQTIVRGARRFTPELDSSDKLIKDYALVIRTVDPLNGSRPILLCAGAHGKGTLGAVMAVTNAEILRQLAPLTKRYENFAAILAFDCRHLSPEFQGIVACDGFDGKVAHENASVHSVTAQSHTSPQ